MPLLSDELSVLEIGFRWAGYDPDKLWPRIPLPIRDNFRNLITEIHEERLECWSLGMEKYSGDDPEEAKLHIRYWLEAVENCRHGLCGQRSTRRSQSHSQQGGASYLRKSLYEQTPDHHRHSE